MEISSCFFFLRAGSEKSIGQGAFGWVGQEAYELDPINICLIFPFFSPCDISEIRLNLLKIPQSYVIVSLGIF